ncbi:hypothetical protein [Lelliottia wanjuensis]|uniref:hypothetical protein n=1 Tax=Lelliottia wanjuensis TaxID=3050585 RepID=UPI00254A94AB|nr:hypothetical protein [Lelliottia sp. V86_10]MDK9585436.1 hypothetical protein [Lelliottia sp. V86_10]
MTKPTDERLRDMLCDLTDLVGEFDPLDDNDKHNYEMFDEMRSAVRELQEYRNAPVSLLRCFYVAYDGWLKNGANDGGIFTFEAGLCANAYDYFQNIGVDSTGPLNEMHAAFVAAGLNEKLPFNESPEQYAEEQNRGGCHANPSRVEWVRSQVAAAPQQKANYPQQAAAPCRRNEMGFIEPCQCQQCRAALELARGMENDPIAGAMSLVPADRKQDLI